MRFPLRKIVDFAMKQPEEVDRGYGEFFGQLPFDDLKKEWEELFLEWLIFDFELKNGATFLAEYILRDPDKLSKKQMSQFEQIIKTHFYSQFEIGKIKRGEWLDGEDLFTGKIYRIYDRKGSESISGEGTLPGRLAKVDGKWYLVGANSVYFPVTNTERMKKMMREVNPEKYTPKDTVVLLRSHEENESRPPLTPPTKKQIKAKQKKLKGRYEKMMKKFGAKLTFEKLAKEIYEEERVNVADFWMGLVEKGLPEEALMTNLNLLQDMWNFLPHKILKGKSPAEMASEYGEMK